MFPDDYDIEALPGDFPWSVSWPTGKIGTVNGGFVRINSNPITISFMKAVMQHMHKSHISDDQHSINHLLDDMKIQWTAQMGCGHGFGKCHIGNTTKNNVFEPALPRAITIRLLDKPHFPVLASWKRHECNLKFYMLGHNIPDQAQREAQYYYTPIIVHPAGSDKHGKAKVEFFKSAGLWFLQANHESVAVPSRDSKDESLHVEYLDKIVEPAMITEVDRMAAFFNVKRKGLLMALAKNSDLCYL